MRTVKSLELPVEVAGSTSKFILLSEQETRALFEIYHFATDPRGPAGVPYEHLLWCLHGANYITEAEAAAQREALEAPTPGPDATATAEKPAEGETEIKVDMTFKSPNVENSELMHRLWYLRCAEDALEKLHAVMSFYGSRDRFFFALFELRDANRPGSDPVKVVMGKSNVPQLVEWLGLSDEFESESTKRRAGAETKYPAIAEHCPFDVHGQPKGSDS